MSAADYDAWQETVYLLRSPENARRLMEAVARDKTGRAGPTGYTKSIDELKELAGGQECGVSTSILMPGTISCFG
ncbi:hypothetical protein MBRA_52700 (plasmid) [Mycobacterium branderi]|nr:hypothetical protein MBRA_52700 [Mycobacterium branderi]